MGWLSLLTKGKKVAGAIKNVPPFTKTGAKSVSEWKNKAGLSKLKAAGFGAVQSINKTAQSLKKLNETLKKQKKILDK
jgi:hypothetical protein